MRRTSQLDKTCRAGAFDQGRDAHIFAAVRATGIRLAELVAIRNHPGSWPRAVFGADDLHALAGRLRDIP